MLAGGSLGLNMTRLDLSNLFGIALPIYVKVGASDLGYLRTESRRLSIHFRVV